MELEIGDLRFSIPDEPGFSREELIHFYWNFHPRFRFFKTLSPNSKLLDIGAGEGNLVYWKTWSSPGRSDIEMYALDLKRGTQFDSYKDFQICNLDAEPIKFRDGLFDAVLMSHVLEHIKDEKRLIGQIRRVLKPGGAVYMEIPAPATTAYPSRTSLAEKGIRVSILNFFDDLTHLRTFGLEEFSALVAGAGFGLIETGVIRNSLIEDDMLSYGIKANDQQMTTYALWSKLKWAQYVIAEKNQTLRSAEAP